MTDDGDDDPWSRLKRTTPARIGLGRFGAALPTAEVLRFGLAHARARDAVHRALETKRLSEEIARLGFEVVEVASRAMDRATYLRRPDLGRALSHESREAVRSPAASPDLALVVADGLSAQAVETSAVPLLAALKPWIVAAGWSVAPLALATQARVALGDEVGEQLGARAAVVLIGERPGLSSPDSLGAYLTFAPRAGRTDAERNCISNIRPAGLSYSLAAFKIAWHLEEMLKRGLSGVVLKDESDALLSDGRPPAPRLSTA